MQSLSWRLGVSILDEFFSEVCARLRSLFVSGGRARSGAGGSFPFIFYLIVHGKLYY